MFKGEAELSMQAGRAVGWCALAVELTLQLSHAGFHLGLALFFIAFVHLALRVQASG